MDFTAMTVVGRALECDERWLTSKRLEGVSVGAYTSVAV